MGNMGDAMWKITKITLKIMEPDSNVTGRRKYESLCSTTLMPKIDKINATL
jgi:hypothetical protein